MVWRKCKLTVILTIAFGVLLTAILSSVFWGDSALWHAFALTFN